ncbi:MAG: 3-deoxy-manno-octulosonate cytidylyltransferase [Pseudomonadota bacterium]
MGQILILAQKHKRRSVMNITAIIPARLAASRFPNKPMAPILGMPMIGHVYFRAKMCSHLDDVWVATCDEEIFNYINFIGGKAVMTADSHQRASDRAAEAIVNIEQKENVAVDYVAMIQGDEPMLMPGMINDLINPVINDPTLKITNLINKIETEEEFNNYNIIKVVLDLNDFVLYFSREPIPSKRNYSGVLPMWKQLGIILFEKNLLLEYINLSPTPLEIIESVDMNRLLEHGRRIKMVKTKFKSYGVDVPGDITFVEEQLKRDPLVAKYLKV